MCNFMTCLAPILPSPSIQISGLPSSGDCTHCWPCHAALLQSAHCSVLTTFSNLKFLGLSQAKTLLRGNSKIGSHKERSQQTLHLGDYRFYIQMRFLDSSQVYLYLSFSRSRSIVWKKPSAISREYKGISSPEKLWQPDGKGKPCEDEIKNVPHVPLHWI